jgi:hypothetical protein
METVPVTGLEELDEHLDELVDDSSIDLNAKLFDHVELQLTGTVRHSYELFLFEF